MTFLRFIRDTAFVKWTLWAVVAALLITIFFVWGGAGQGTSGVGGQDFAVSVDGEKVSQELLRYRYRSQVQNYRRALGDQFNQDFVRGMASRLAGQMADEIIQHRMADEFGLMVSDEEVATMIQRIYEFENPAEDYPEQLSRIGLSAQDYEQYVRSSLLIEKLNALVSDGTFLGESEISRLYTEQNEKYKATVALVKNLDYRAKVPYPTEEELQARYLETKDTLLIPEKRTIKYLLIDPNQVRQSLEIGDEQVRAFYESHKDQYSIPDTQRRASHILIRAAANADEVTKEAARAKAQDLYDRAKGGEDFAELAKENSEDTSASMGGDLGWFERTAMVKPFADAVFDECKNAGQVVGPVETQFGYHVIQLTGVGGSARPFMEVQDQVRTQMLMTDPDVVKEFEQAYDGAVQALKDAQGEPGVNQFAADRKLQVVPVTVPFTRDDQITGLGGEKDLLIAVFSAEKDVWQPPMEFKSGWIRFVVNSLEPEHPASFEEAKKDIREALLIERATGKAEEEARELAGISGSQELMDRAATLGIETKETSTLRVIDLIPLVGKDRKVAQAFMDAEVGTTVGPLKHKDGWVVAVVTEHTAVDEKKFADEKEQFGANQQRRLAREWIQDYVALRRSELQAKNAILVNGELVDQLDRTSATDG